MEIGQQDDAIALGTGNAMQALMAKYPDRAEGAEYTPTLQIMATRPAARFAAWYEFFPRSQSRVPGQHGTLQDSIRALPRIKALGFDVIYLPPIHPIGHAFRKGKNNSLDGRAGRRGQPLGHRQRARRPHGAGAEAGHVGRLGRLRRCLPCARHRDRAGLRDELLARPPLRGGAPRLVLSPPRRLDQVRREPAQEVPGRLPAQLRHGRPRGAVERDAAHLPVLDRQGRDHLPRRQPAHQAGDLLGVGDRRGPQAASGHDLPGRGLHQAQDDAPAGQGRLHPVLHLLHLAQHQAGADRVRHRADRWGR